MFPCAYVSSISSPVREYRRPPHRCPCAAVSGSIGCSSIPSTVCCLAGAPVSGSLLSLRFDFSLQILVSPASRAADEAPCEEFESMTNP
ncbi:hypothetical protein TIFTF001_026926 [Ficus carica]|uniref:Uncharacterized protein n=1 Tax=Ficus carica TaxID=3494 RepID=A0AA88DME4_FICCA|nr:hypothetical protein TIFTF001_026926 [Ficus carica]